MKSIWDQNNDYTNNIPHQQASRMLVNGNIASAIDKLIFQLKRLQTQCLRECADNSSVETQHKGLAGVGVLLQVAR